MTITDIENVTAQGFFSKKNHLPTKSCHMSFHLKKTQKNAEGFSPLKLDPQLPQLQNHRWNPRRQEEL